MAPYHTVKEGDYLIKIAKEYGFDDYRIIWNHPQNVELKIKRKSANGLFPGDSLFVPEKEEDKAYYGTGRHHVIQLGPEPNILRIVLKNVDGDPIANTECTLRAGGETYHLITNSDGLVAEIIPNSAEQGEISILDLDIPILIGELDPVETERGQKVRLINLGYCFGSPDEQDEEQLKSAVEEFQCDQGLNVTGVCDGQTQAALKDAHGC